jgi:hypothetical protein
MRHWLKAAREKANAATVNGRLKRQRSAASNGKKLIPGFDGRSPWVRRCKDIIEAHISEDMGGADNCSVAERSLIRRAAVLTTQLEVLEHKFALNDGEASADDLDMYQRVTNTLRRTLESLGLKRRQRDITNGITLGDLIRQDQHEERQRLSEVDDAEIVQEAAE